ncbi:hypothetical protein ARNL5_03687 [Anaerolineae bacterium]|nr:hypothetical protein ARNL5_03687 [Anaerolineae bacterium]
MIKRNVLSRTTDVPGFTNDAILGFLYDAVMWKQPVQSLEIGTFMGRSASVICDALNVLGGDRKLICVDSYHQTYNAAYLERSMMQYMINRCGPEIRRLYTDFDKLQNLEDCFRLTVERHPAMQRRCTLVKGDTKTLDFTRFPFVDLVYIDGDHEYEGVRSDFLNVLTRLKPGGLVIFDDYYEDFPGVMRLVDEATATSGCVYVGNEGQDIGFIIPDPASVRETLSEPG